MSNARLLPLLAILALGLGACKVTVGGGTSPDEARPNGESAEGEAPAEGGEAASEGEGEGEGEGETEGGGASAAAAGGDFAAAEGGEAGATGSPCPEGVNPGDTFKDDCNNCKCGEDGQAMCTRMMCDAESTEDAPQ